MEGDRGAGTRENRGGRGSGGGRGNFGDAGVLRVREAGEKCKTLLVVIY